jgi:hypothetical protein
MLVREAQPPRQRPLCEDPARILAIVHIGEWHSHPSFSVHPSPTDISTMTEIVEDEAAEITFAVLLIVRTKWRFWIEHSLTIFARGYAPTATRIRPQIVRI